MSLILAVDLGKFKSVACLYDTVKLTHTFRTISTMPQVMHDVIVGLSPDRLVIEIGSAAGWIQDLAEALDVPIQIANPNHEAWRWKSVKRKTDRDDALKLAKLSAMDQLPTIQLPSRRVRQWRSVITYRHTLVSRRTSIKNSVRSILDRQGMSHVSGKAGWTSKSLVALRRLSLPLSDTSIDELWRGQLSVELIALEQVEQLINQVEEKLKALASSDERVLRLQSIPGVGPRLAELMVAVIDNPKRFKNAKQVGAYAGLVPRLIESGTMSRTGRITRRGNRLLRALLVEVSWLMRQYNEHFRKVFDRVCRGSKARRKIAVVATARKLLVTCWAMLRDGTSWRDPTAMVLVS